MDGTFDWMLLLFNQLYMIRAPHGNSAISCIYALLSSKTQTTLEELLADVVQSCTGSRFDPDPTNIFTDNEKAVINSSHTQFGDDVRCFYHLTQNTWHKVQALGLVFVSNMGAYILRVFILEGFCPMQGCLI